MNKADPGIDFKSQLEKWQLQLRKGVLLYMVLSLLNKQEMYGYSLISSLSKKMSASMAEGTIYPLLNRMVRNGNISFEWRIMESGPARKYYKITDSGNELLAGMHSHWQGINEKLQGLRDDSGNLGQLSAPGRCLVRRAGPAPKSRYTDGAQGAFTGELYPVKRWR